MMEGPGGEFDRVLSVWAYRTSGRREDKKHTHGGGRDPAVDHNPIV